MSATLRFRLLCTLFIFVSQVAYAQKEASVWYFGQRAGLSFATGTPVVLTDGRIDTNEGVASMSDENGQLLFYTEGTQVWNRKHDVMPNGSGLLGHASSSQSAVIVPKINDPGRYYLFTVAAEANDAGFNYSIVNMALDGGNGDLEEKNVQIISPVTEKVTAVKHCNGRDIWVIVHLWNSAAMHAYLITDTGINAAPVVSSPGMFISSMNSHFAIGCMKVSPDGKKIALAHARLGAELLDFDNSTGIVSGGGTLFLPTETYGHTHGAYGVEFSPNSRFLYISGDYYPQFGQPLSYVLQYDVRLPDMPSIRASKFTVYEQQLHRRSTENFGTLQMAPDGKMYLAESSQPHLSVINFPDLPQAACGFVHAGITMDAWSMYGLPAFIQSFFRSTFTYRGACEGNILDFDYEKSSTDLSVKWDFGDSASGIQNTSTLASTQHHFSAEGIYAVKLIRVTACGSDTLVKNVNVGSGSNISLGADTTYCGISAYQLTPKTTGTNNIYLWQDGSTGPSFKASKDGLYWMQVTNAVNGCSNRDSIRLAFKPDPIFSLGPDQRKCVGDIVDLSVNVPAIYNWSNGAVNNSVRISQSGIYWLDVTLDGCTKRDSITIAFDNYPIVNLGNDTTLCEGASLLLDVQNPGMQYKWQNNANSETLRIQSAGTYSVQVRNNNCVVSDEINIRYLDKPKFRLGRDTIICQGTVITFAPTIEKGEGLTFLWSTGSTDTTVTTTQQGYYTLTITNECGTQTDGLNVSKGICEVYVPSAFSPNRDGLNDVFKVLHGANVSEFNLEVYNRWGQIVFSSNDIKKGWDGTHKGQQQDAGIFVWVIRYKVPNDNNRKVMKGALNLIR
jgi:gliding motility-associated-like protein